jgi:hypothetical protein
MRANDGRVPLELAATVLGQCDQARYAPPDAVPTAEDCRATIARAAQVIGP